jgi:hypothetical protein
LLELLEHDWHYGRDRRWPVKIVHHQHGPAFPDTQFPDGGLVGGVLKRCDHIAI